MQWREHIWLLAFYPLETIKKRSYLIGFILFLIFVLSGSQIFHAHADESASLASASRSERQALISDTQMSDALRRALFDHPSIRQAGARSCRAVFVLGQRQAERRPQLSASVSGARELAKNYRANQDDRTGHNVPIRSSSRAYDNERNDLYDLEVSARYRLFDWGVGQSLVRGETNRLHAKRLSYEMQLARLSQDMLRLLMQIESGKQDIAIRQASLREVVSHQEAVEAQGQAGTLGLARVREIKLLLLDAELELQRTKRAVAESITQLEATYRIGYDEALPLLHLFLARSETSFPFIEPEMWREVRVLDYRIQAEQASLRAISHEGFPVLDSVFETTFFDMTDFESEYQIVRRLEMSMPLYDGGSRRAREQEKDWQLRELTSQRDEKIREHQRDQRQSQLIISQREEEISNIRSQLDDIEARHASLEHLIQNGRAERQDIIQLILSRAQKQIALDSLLWQQEFAFVQIHWLADQLLAVLGFHSGEYTC